MEVQLEEESEDPILRLKNGGQIKAGEGRIQWRDLTALLQQEPDLFRALLALALGRPEAMSAEHRKRLRYIGGFLERDGSIIPYVRDVLLSAYQETAEGPVLVNPFILESEEQAREFERRDNEAADWLLRELRKKEDAGKPLPERKRKDNKGRPPGRD
jgi:hypothetical protein